MYNVGVYNHDDAILKFGKFVSLLLLDTVDQCSKVIAVVHGVVMGIEMPFTLPNSDGCVDSGLTCPINKGSTYEYSTTLPVLKSYPKV